MRNATIKTFTSNIGDGQIHMMHIHPKDDTLHRHSFFELVYIVSGSAVHQLGDETAPLSPGDYFIIDPGSAHCYKDTCDFELINCLFLPEYIDRALADCPSLSALLSDKILHFGVPVDIRAADRIFHDSDGSVKRLLFAMEQEYAARQTGYMELLRCNLTQALVCAVRASEIVGQARTVHRATEQISAYLHDNYALPLSLHALSRIAGYTPQYLSALFHKDTGMSIQEFLQRLRIERACLLLSQRGAKPTAVATAVGYSDPKHFSKLFRRYKGMSPKTFQKNVF